MSIVTYPLNGITYDADDVQTYLCTRTSGVYADEDCFDLTISDDMEVTIGTGLAWIKNSDFAGKSVCMDEATTLTISYGTSTYARVDRIILKFDAEANATTLEVLEGTPASSPVGTDIEQDETIYELCLYEITVPGGTTELTASMITDTRADEDLCGLMRDGVTTIPTATLQAAATELIEKIQSDLESVEDGSAYMLSTVYDEKGGAKQVAFEDDIGDLIDEYLPFSLAISNGTYGYLDTSGNFSAFRNPTGNATAAQLLSGYVASNATTENFTGTMNNWGSNTITLTSSNTATRSAGYYSSISVNAAGLYSNAYSAGNSSGYATGYAAAKVGNATAARVLNGYTFTNANSVGTTGTMNNWGSNTITLTSSNTATRSAGYYSSISVNAAGLYSNAYSAGNTAGYNTGYTAGNSAGYSAAKVGNATAARVLNGYTFTNANSVGATGSMNNWGSNTVNMTSNTKTLSAGYYSSISINAASRYTAGYNAKTMTRTSLGSNSSGGRTVYTLTYNAKSISGYANFTSANFAITALSTAMYFSAGSSYSGSRNALSLSLSYNASNGIVTLSNTAAYSSGSGNNAGYDNFDNYVSAATVRCYYA